MTTSLMPLLAFLLVIAMIPVALWMMKRAGLGGFQNFDAALATPQVVKQRLGHGSLRTTEKYLHTLPDADETALDALARMRSRASSA